MAPQPPLHPPHAFDRYEGLPPFEPSRFSSNPSFDRDFLKAVFDGDLRLVKRAARTLGRGAEGSRLAEKLGEVSDGFGMRLVHYAALGGSLPMCRYLLEDLRLDVDADGPFGATAIRAAIALENVELVRYFLDQGADTEKLDDDGCTLLHLASKQGNYEIVKLLLSKGAHVNAISLGGTALHVAASNGRDDIVKILLDYDADHNIALSGTDSTALVLATIMSSVKCVKLLLEYGRTPIEIVALSGRREHVEILFPFTSRISSVRDWSVDGVISHVKSVLPSKEAMLSSAKSKAHKEFKNGNYLVATKIYDEAMALDPGNATLLSNRSICWLRFGDARKALRDARACRMMRPGWSKACYREGTALMLLKDYENACSAFLRGIELEPGNAEMEEALREALESLKIAGSIAGN